MVKLLTLCFFITCAVPSFSQIHRSSIKGNVKDITSKLTLHNTSVVLVEEKTNFIVLDTRANSEGDFELKNVASGNYTILFTRPGYVDFSKKITVDDKNLSLDLGPIELYKKDILLNEVVVKAQVSAIKIMRDTVEFKADSFKVQPNASVEDLLKQLPSIQIDQNGIITAQGKTVKKVLVDGEEFFGTDPLLVTRNLRADMIDKVQLYDKKSDVAEFTGINDGVKDKTINLKLKQSKKQGYFGKASAGIGNKKFYSGQGLANVFEGDRKLSAYLTTGNIGQSGLAKEDKERINSDEEGDGSFDGKGVPKITSAGLHYDDRWDENKKTVNANAKIYSGNVDEISSTISETGLVNEIFKQNSTSQSNNMRLSNKYNLVYKDNYNKNSTFKIYTDFTYQKDKKNSISNSQNSNADFLILENEKYRESDDVYRAVNLNLEWQKKFKKVGRTFSAYLNNNFYDYTSVGKSTDLSTNFNELKEITNVSNLRLDKNYISNNKTVSLTTVYTDKISEKLSLSLNYFTYHSKFKQNGQAFNDEKHEVLNGQYSGYNILDDTNNKLSLTFNYNYKKLFLNVGSGYSADQFKIDDVNNQFKLEKNYGVWDPRVNINYKFTDYSNLELTYTGKTNKPNPNNLVPLAYNNNLTVNFLPNYDLQTTFANKFDLNFGRYWVESQTYFNTTFSYTNTTNPIIAAIDISPNAVYTYRYENLFDRSSNNFNYNILYSTKLKGIDASVYGGSSASFSKSFSKSNSVLNELNSNNYNLYFGLEKTKEKKYSLSYQNVIAYNQNQFLIQSSKNDYFTVYGRASADVYLGKLQLHTDGNYQWQQKTEASGKSFKRFIWNAWVGKNFFKKDDLLIKIACNDILNQNNGYSRISSNNSYTENTYNTIQRFFLLSAVWNFTKFNNKSNGK